MLTELGKFLRKLRIEREEILKTMADKLNVTVSFLSAVETGKRPMPGPWAQKISDLYELNEVQKAEFSRLEAEITRTVSFDLGSSSLERRGLVLTFARKFENLDEETIKKIRKLLV
jgi:transcriptional regulator with XRE-family HTH domain